ncbi:MAG TPA: SGNH/GDSL hydrolase family protein [Opitutaceae bacterium]|nr:SGNH/GDSL hydrolase family protein [Opitutaceae bacterium]
MKPLVVCVVALGLVAVQAAEPKLAPPATAPAGSEKALAPVPDVPGLPRVLILGDSISIGYMVGVRERLQGRANVHRPAENCGETARGIASLDKWLGDKKWDVVHFNFGLHDVKYLDPAGKYVTPDKGKQVATLAEYEGNLRAIVTRLKKTGAKLIFATTTPVPAKSSGRVENDELRYNEVAVRVMKELGVAIDDLHAFVKPRQATIQRPNNVHFTDEGSAELAGVVAASIESALPPARAR